MAAETGENPGGEDKRPSVHLKVAEAKNRDVIRGKIRLDNNLKLNEFQYVIKLNDIKLKKAK